MIVQPKVIPVLINFFGVSSHHVPSSLKKKKKGYMPNIALTLIRKQEIMLLWTAEQF